MIMNKHLQKHIRWPLIIDQYQESTLVAKFVQMFAWANLRPGVACVTS